jgi:uncharacterized protein (DUF2249 family)
MDKQMSASELQAACMHPVTTSHSSVFSSFISVNCDDKIELLADEYPESHGLGVLNGDRQDLLSLTLPEG